MEKKDNVLEISIMAAIRAGKEIMHVYNQEFKVEIKSDNSPLTIADKNANSVINKHLLKTGIPILSEENDLIDYKIRKKWKKLWIVDPLDGTKEFVKRNGEFTVNIALIEEEKPILGVIYVPVSKKLYFGDTKLKKAYTLVLNDGINSIEEIFNSANLIHHVKRGNNSFKVVGSRSHMNSETLNFVESLRKEGKEVEIISRGSSLKFCMVAEGVADVYPRFAPTMEWDTAAAHAICNATGVSVSSNLTSNELVYNKENLLNPGFICK